MNPTGFQRFESFWGAIFCSLIALPVVGSALALLILEVSGQVPPDTPTWIRLLLYPAAVADTWLLWQVWRHFRNKWHPIAPRVARALPDVGVQFRWFLAVFWLCHFASCVFASLVPFEMCFDTFEDGFASLVTPVIWRVGFAYTGNIFLLLALYAITLKESILRYMWRHRWAIDLAIASSCTAISIIFETQIKELLNMKALK